MEHTLSLAEKNGPWNSTPGPFNGSDERTNSCTGLNNTGTCTDTPPYALWQTVFIASLAGVLSLVTVVGNLIVIMSFIIERTIRQPTNYYIASLAVSDLLIGSISMPFFTVYLLKGETWPLGEILCDLWLSIDYTVCLTSIYTVFCITIDRFCSVKIPAKYRNWRTERKVVIIISITWIVPAILFFTSIFGWQYFVGERTVKTKEKGECRIQYMDNSIFNCVLQISYFWVTLVVMCSLYAGIYKVALDLHKKSQAKKNKMTSLVSMAGQTMTKIGIGMSQQQNINTNKLFPPQKPSNSESKHQRGRGASTTSFSSTRGDKDERSSSPAFPSDTDPDSNSPAKHSDSHQEKRPIKKRSSSKSPKKLKKGPLKSKSTHIQHKDSLKQSLMPDDTTMDKSFTTETTGLLTQLHNSSGSTATNSTSGFVSNVSNASSTINTNIANEEKLPLHRNSLLMAEANYKAQQAHPKYEDLGEPQIKPDHSKLLMSGTQCNTLDDRNAKDILQGAKYLDENFLKALQASQGLTLVGELNAGEESITGCHSKDDEDVFYAKPSKDLSPVWKRKSWLEEQQQQQQQLNDRASKSNWENVQDPFSVNDNVNSFTGTAECNGSKSTGLPLYSNGSLGKLNSGKQGAIKGQPQTTTNPHNANGQPFSICEETNHGLLINGGGETAGDNSGGTTGSNTGGGSHFPNGSLAEKCDIPNQVSHTSITGDNDVRQYNPSLCPSNKRADDCIEAPSLSPQETEHRAITGTQEGSGDCRLMSAGLSLTNSNNLGSGLANGIGGGAGGEWTLYGDNTRPGNNDLIASVQRVNGCETTGQEGLLLSEAETVLKGGKYGDVAEKNRGVLEEQDTLEAVEDEDCSNNNSSAVTAIEITTGRDAIEGIGRDIDNVLEGQKNLLSPVRYRHLKSTSDESINNDHPSSSTSKASDCCLGETSNEGPHSPNADNVTFAPRSSRKGGGSGNRPVNKRKRRKVNNANNKNGGTNSQFRNFIKSSRRRERKKPEKQKSKSENRARKALRTITIILGAFVLCWTPWHVFSMFMGFNVYIPIVLYNISYWFCYLNSPINPFCYAFANQQFKKTFIRIMKLDWHRT